MGKFASDDIMDGALSVVKNNVNLMVLCSAQPTTRAEAISTYALADVAMASGDFTITDGDANGRKVTVASKLAVLVDTTGEGNHVALVDATRLLVVTVCTPQSVVAGSVVNFPAWDEEISDPI